jgi:carbonic anhydrase
MLASIATPRMHSMRRTGSVALVGFVLGLAATTTAQRTPDEALQALMDGNRRFASGMSAPQPLGEGVRRTLARGQSPIAVVVCCADSRVPPEHVFNAGLGELIVVRVAGHAADAETIASIEQAVEGLEVPLCVVMAHSQCDTIAAAIAGIGQHGGHSQWSPSALRLLERIEPAVRKARGRDLGGDALQAACEEEHAHATVHECLRRSPLLRRYAAVGRFRMIAARYHLGSGQVEWLPGRPLPPAPEAKQEIPTGAVPTTMPPHVALRLLQGGHRRFLGDRRPPTDLSAGRRESLTHGQQPLAIVLTCTDSRVAPEHVFDVGLGELYVVRIGANALTDDALASIEMAARRLGSPLLVVMGHTNCDVMARATGGKDQLTGHQHRLLGHLEPSLVAARHEAAGRDLAQAAMRHHLLRSLSEARSRSALLRQLEQEGRFTMLATVYDVATGDLQWIDEPAPANRGHDTPGQASHEQGASGHDVHGHAPVDHEARGHGTDAHGSHPRAQAAHGHDNGHGEEPLPTLQWAPAPTGEVHGTTPALRDHRGNAHGGHGTAAQAHGDGHGGHHEAAHAGDGHPPKLSFRDPVVLVGLTGITSLLLAAVLALRQRG